MVQIIPKSLVGMHYMITFYSICLPNYVLIRLLLQLTHDPLAERTAGQAAPERSNQGSKVG